MKKISAVILSIFIMTALIFTMSSCGDDGNESNDGKQIPVYTGMSISSAEVHLTSYNGNGNNGNGNNGDNGNHYGHYKGDYDGKNEDVDEEDPFPENSADENIEKELESSLNVVGAAQDIYYAQPNEKIFITIHIDNPDSFEIMSFTLNGQKYTNYMFEDGSDMENIILEYDVGNAHGVVEYTIDAIKYIDGTEIKDVLIEGNKTVKAGIRTENQVSAQITDLKVEFNKISFKANIKDNDGLVAFSGGKVLCGIYDGFNLVGTKELAIGENEVVFEGLNTNTLYQYGIIGYYNDLSGEGMVTKVLCMDALYTNAIVLFDDITVGKEDITFSLKWHNDHENKVLTSLKLYKGEEVVETLDIADLSVDGLLSANDYYIIAEYANGAKTESIRLDFTTQAKAIPDVVIEQPTKTQTGIGFTITETDVDNVGEVAKIELLHGEDTPVVASDLTVRAFTNLLSNNTYTVKVTYVYDLNDGNGEKTITKTLDITTEAKSTPDVVIEQPTKTQTSLGFTLTETDVDNVGAITKIELLYGEDTPVVATDLTVRAFADLLSNNTYTVKVTYVYDLNDGIGEQTITKTLDITTEAKAVPSFEIKNENITTESINAEYDITDIDNILASYKVELYKGTTLVSENDEKEISFNALNYYTDYTLKITYTYDLNDGNGVQTSSVEKTYKTLPHIDVIECNIANTSAVSEGETIFMSVKLDNPLNMSIESVVINGERYNVTGASTKNKIFVEIVYNGQFEGGDTYFKVDKVNAKLDNEIFTVEPKSELSDNVFINGKLEVLKIEYVNGEFEPIDLAFPSDTVYLLITLDNPTGYIIDSINTSTTDLIKIDNEHWYYEATLYTGWNTGSLSSINYHNEYISRSLLYSDIKTNCFKVASDEIKYISTPDDLKNADDGYYYELTNDIDLAGLEWIGAEFRGLLDGKGYSVKNMSFVGTVKDKNAYLGLFSYGSGFIQNLNIKEATIIAEITSDDEKSYTAYCGAFVANTSGIININNCTVDEYTTISVKNSSGVSYVGGMVGYAYSNTTVTIENSTNSGSISATSEKNDGAYAGGMVGYAYSTNNTVTVTITNSTNSGSISATSGSIYSTYAGGMVGYGSNSTVTIENSTNSGDVSATSKSGGAYAGGMVGYGSTVTITNSTNSGDVSATSESIYSANAGGMVGSGGTVTITNSTNSGDVSATNECYFAYAGGMVGEGNNVTITNSINSGSISGSYAGGMVGSGSTVTITNSTNSSSISGSYAGGMVGSGSTTITNSTNSGDVSATSESIYSANAGGMVGEGNNVTITNSINSGSISATSESGRADAGGMVGYANSTVTIENSTNSGDVSATSESGGANAGGMVGYGNTVTIENSYSLISGNGNYNGESCSLEELNTKTFYTETLGWSEDIWDLSDLDYENGKYPVLK